MNTSSAAATEHHSRSATLNFHQQQNPNVLTTEQFQHFERQLQKELSLPSQQESGMTAPNNHLSHGRPETAGVFSATSMADKAATQQVLECDYDQSPTELYQAIEAKQWDYVKKLLSKEYDHDLDDGEAGNHEDNDPNMNRLWKLAAEKRATVKQQAATWVVRKESNGRLRWRLLPLHAAVIFHAPAVVIELLVQEFPDGAAAKDDQGMLPLHLAVRNPYLDWQVLEELLTAHPAAVFVKDRKGRTPLQAGLAAAVAQSRSNGSHHSGQGDHTRPPSAASTNSHTHSPPMTPTPPDAGSHAKGRSQAPTTPTSAALAASALKQQQSELQRRATLHCLELYTNIYVAGEKTKWLQEYKSIQDSRLAGLAEQHAARLTELRDEFAREQATKQGRHEAMLLRLREELVKASQRETGHHQMIQDLKKQIQDLQQQQQEPKQEDRELPSPETAMAEEELKRENDELRRMVFVMLDQQKSLVESFDRLNTEQKELNERRHMLMHQYMEVNEQAAATSQAHASVWKEQLQELHADMSARVDDLCFTSHGGQYHQGSRYRPDDMNDEDIVKNHDGQRKPSNPLEQNQQYSVGDDRRPTPADVAAHVRAQCGMAPQLVTAPMPPEAPAAAPTKERPPENQADDWEKGHDEPKNFDATAFPEEQQEDIDISPTEEADADEKSRDEVMELRKESMLQVKEDLVDVDYHMSLPSPDHVEPPATQEWLSSDPDKEEQEGFEVSVDDPVPTVSAVMSTDQEEKKDEEEMGIEIASV